ncbi:MAG TPA: hypothetical protein VES20_21160 [Bryobacteraceae bacterium]|nr:hypothetical protein [Bryobacteraceae bacterium]
MVFGIDPEHKSARLGRFSLRTAVELNEPSSDKDTFNFGEWLSLSLLFGPRQSPHFTRVNANDPALTQRQAMS